MEKLRFEVTAKARKDDEKKTSLYLTSITTTKGEIFEMPEEFQDINLHTNLAETEAFKKVKNAIKKRHQKRNFWVVMNKTLRDIYIDEGENIQFADCILEERFLEVQTSSDQINPVSGISKEDLQEIINNISGIRQEHQKNMNKLAEKFVLGKFNTKTNNVKQWINTFKSECVRLGLNEDQEKIEVLRLFLEGSCIDWYSSMLTKHTLASEWITWESTLCETYEDKGWSPIKYAISFKYISGPLIDYALRKEKILLELDKSIDDKMIMNLIVAGLPDFITEKINKSKVKETKDLLNEIKMLEYLTKAEKPNKSKDSSTTQNEKKKNKTPCQICDKMGKKNRYHSEDKCWFNKKNGEENIDKKVKMVNNSQLEVELQNEDQKN